MKHLQHMLAIYVYGHCNICNIQIKHLQYTFETAEHSKHTLVTYVCSKCNIMQHPDKTLATYV
jgi:hypothetical protein